MINLNYYDKAYTNEFKIMLVELLNSGRPIKELSLEYSLKDSMLRCWKREYIMKSGDFNKKKELSSTELEFKALRKELKEITIERDFLKFVIFIIPILLP